jgi:FtsX extracellular domain
VSRGAKIAVAVVGVAVVALLIVVVVLVEHAGEGHLTASKRVPPDDVEHFDAIIVLPTDSSGFTVSEVEDRMNRLAAVEQFAEVPRRSLAYLVSLGDDADNRVLVNRACTDSATRGYVVTLTDSTPAAQRELASELGPGATVRPSRIEPPQTEVFMKVRATPGQTAAVTGKLEADPDVVDYRFLSHADAYDEFQRLFADQPMLTESEPADGSGLPESFRLELRNGASPGAVAARYEELPGVDTVNVPALTGAVPPAARFDACEPTSP